MTGWCSPYFQACSFLSVSRSALGQGFQDVSRSLITITSYATSMNPHASIYLIFFFILIPLFLIITHLRSSPFTSNCKPSINLPSIEDNHKYEYDENKTLLNSFIKNSFIQQILMEHLLCTWHCTRCWGYGNE